jgi:hypothetical protein
MQFDFIYTAPPIGLLAPAADAGGRTGPYKSLRGVSSHITLVCRVNQGNAAQVTFTPLQAQDSSGTGSKAIQAVPVFYNADSTVSDTLVAQTAAASFQTSATALPGSEGGGGGTVGADERDARSLDGPGRRTI